jgi:predicted amidohydrolase YtcJ
MLDILPLLRACPAAAVALFLSMPAGAEPADLVLENARVYTGNDKQPTASAVAVKGARIVWVGDDAKAFIGSKTRRIDAQGQAVVPGFIDSHGHMAGLGEMLESLNLRGVDSVAAVAERVRKAAANAPKGHWIRGRAWDQTNWGGEFPDADPLTRAAPEHPVYLTRVDGHASWVNRKALELAGITKNTSDPQGGRIVRDKNGEPTGILIDRAQGLVSATIPGRTQEQVERYIARAARECARLGLTGVHDAGAGPAELAAYRKLIEERRLPVRVYFMIGGAGELWRDYLLKGPEIGDRLTVRSIKLMADGAMGSRGAAFWQPYSDDPSNSGLLILDKAFIEKVARDAVKRVFK